MDTRSYRIRRRRFIELLAAGSAGLLGSCHLFTRKPRRLCLDTPDLHNPDGPLAIDVHAHVFNASDLQVKEFVARVAGGDSGALGQLARFFGSILQELGWEVAPSVPEELEVLEELAADTCNGEEAGERFYRARDRQYRKTRDRIRAFVPGRKQDIGMRMPMAESREQAAAMQDEIAGLDLAIVSLPETYEQFERGETFGAPRQFTPREVGLRSALDFLIEQFQYRVTCTARYFNEYSSDPELKIDLMCPSMVDYDWWLAGGSATEKSPLPGQVDVYRELAVLAGGRVHAFVPFDPFREAMHRADNSVFSSLELAQDAILGKGAIGVKLYPPMGFAALGNATQDVWRNKDWLPGPAREAGFGVLLDAAMRSLFTWCVEQDVPVMAHTNVTNSPHDDFLPLVGPEFWSVALDEFPGLRVNFAHFGGAGSKGFETDRVRKFLELMADAGRGGNAFADASYFTRLLETPRAVNDGLQALFDSDSGAVLRDRLMYGSDWKMLLLEKHSGDYLRRFRQVIADLSPGDGRLEASFFGANAARFLGLGRGQATRKRLEEFYAANQMETPDWTSKVDALT